MLWNTYILMTSSFYLQGIHPNVGSKTTK